MYHPCTFFIYNITKPARKVPIPFFFFLIYKKQVSVILVLKRQLSLNTVTDQEEKICINTMLIHAIYNSQCP